VAFFFLDVILALIRFQIKFSYYRSIASIAVSIDALALAGTFSAIEEMMREPTIIGLLIPVTTWTNE